MPVGRPIPPGPGGSGQAMASGQPPPAPGPGPRAGGRAHPGGAKVGSVPELPGLFGFVRVLPPALPPFVQKAKGF